MAMGAAVGQRVSSFGRLLPLLPWVAALLASPASAGPLNDGVKRFTPYAIELIDTALAGAETLRERLAAKDIEGARKAWIEAHVPWERAETFTGELYPELDEAIDAWPDGKSGFHALEAKLFAGDGSGGAAAADALAEKLREFAKQIREQGVTAQGLLNGSTQLAFEIGEKKSDGGESAASGTSLDDMRNNLVGVEMVYKTIFQPILSKSDPKLDDITGTEMEEMKRLLQVASLKEVDQGRFGKIAERLAVNLQAAAPRLGLATPSLGD